MTTLIQEQATGIPRSALRHRPIHPDVQEFVVLSPRTTRGKPHYEPHTSGGLPSLARRVHPLALIGLSMFITLIGICLVQVFSSWITTGLNDLCFGRPRTFQVDAFVGHEAATGQASHFIALNLQGHIEIIELPGGDAVHARIFLGPQFYGRGAELVPATISFLDTQHSHRPDMLVQVQGSTIRFHNTGTTFQP